MAQQTAVEWLAKNYNYITWLRNRDEISQETADKCRQDYLEQAKQMEKEQIIKAANTILYSSTGPGDAAAEQYYNETFKK
jgi:hypothetical protein